MRVLCDDVVIAHRTFGTLALSTMYLTARQTSQGEQRTYNVSQEEEKEPTFKRNKQQVQFQDDDDDELPSRVPTMSRQYTVAVKRMEDEEEADNCVLQPMRRMNNCFTPDDDDENAPFSRLPAGLRLCSMAPPPLREEDDEDDDVMSQHKVSDCLATPYSNLRQVSMMRGCSYQSPAPVEEEKEEGEI
jgi:hypothetical protein